jgi:hypothetical protein
MQLPKQTSVMHVPCLRASKRLFAWRYPSAAVLIAPEDRSSLYLSRYYSPLVFAWSEFSTTNQTRRRRSKCHSTKNLDRKWRAQRRDRCRRIRECNKYMSQGRKVIHVRAQMPIHSSDMDANLILHLNPWRATFSTALAASGSSVSRE